VSIVPELETALRQVETLPEGEQRRIASVLQEMIESAACGEIDDAGKQRLLEASLEASEQDRLAGRLIPMEDVFRDLRAMVLSRDG
jgi:hypothetical protein